MDNTFQDEAEALKTAFRRMSAQMRVAIPAKVTEFNAAEQTVTAVPVIRKLVTIDDEQTTLQMPPVIKVPLVFPYAQTAGFALTLPIAKGDMVLLIVADRSIDRWAEFSGFQNPVETVEPRFHDITDSLAVIGATPMPLALPNYQTDGIEMRNRDRSMSVKLTDADITMTAGSTVMNLDKDGNLTINADIIINGISFLNHVHGGVQVGGGTTDVPE